MRYRIAVIALVVPFVLAACLGCGFETPRSGGVVLMSYNLQTLFDPVDQGGEYEDYRVSSGNWGEAAYKSKLAALAAVIQSVAPPGGPGTGGTGSGGSGTGGGGPDIIVVQEAENERTLRDLSEAAGGYQWVIASPDEESALRCGVLSRYPPVSTKAHRVRPSDGAPSSVPRHVLEVELDVDGRRLLVIAVHLKSKLGGAEETEPERAATAAFVSAIIADKVADDPNLAVIVAGDFNENPDEYERVDHAYTTAMMPAEAGAGPWLCVTGSRDAPAGPVLFCPWEESTGYSYLYQGTPERIDNILASQALVHDGACPFRFEAFSAEPPEFAVTSTGAPIRWDQNTSTGYSDHLPIQALLVFTP